MLNRYLLSVSSMFAGCVVSCALSLAAHAQDIPTCPVPDGFIATSDLATLPPVVRSELKWRIGTPVAPGANFDRGDVSRYQHNRRLIFIWHRDDRWIIATEHGGLFYNDPIFAFVVSPEGAEATLVAQRIAQPHSVCAKAQELLTTREDLPLIQIFSR